MTTLNTSTALIYPISVWTQTEKMLQEPSDDAAAKADVAFIANHYGEDVEIDAQGRVLMPALLRRELELEKDDVHLVCYKQRIEVLGEQDLWRAADFGENQSTGEADIVGEEGAAITACYGRRAAEKRSPPLSGLAERVAGLPGDSAQRHLH